MAARRLSKKQESKLGMITSAQKDKAKLLTDGSTEGALSKGKAPKKIDPFTKPPKESLFYCIKSTGVYASPEEQWRECAGPTE